jgi:hypothetical protein
MEEFGRLRSIGCGKSLHLGEHIKKLRGWECVEGSGDCIGASQPRWKVDTEGKRWN